MKCSCHDCELESENVSFKDEFNGEYENVNNVKLNNIRTGLFCVNVFDVYF